MACGLKSYSALAAFLLAASPSWAMSIVTAPSNNDGTSRFTDPNAKPQRGFSGSVTTVIVGWGGGSFGYGGSAILGSGPFGSRTLGPSDPPISDIPPVFPNPGFPYSAPSGFNQPDSFSGFRDVYPPTFRGNGR